MRLFTAIPLPKETKDQVAEITRGRLPVAYVNTVDLHITLNFFGEMSDAEVEKAKIIFESFLAGKKSFPIEFDKIMKMNQQIHLTVKPTPELLRFQAEMEKEFLNAGFEFQDRAYYPHVKLANMHMDKLMHTERKTENFPNELLQQLNFTAKHVIFFESKLLMHHAKHIPILEKELA